MSVRRLLLDPILAEAAAGAGAEVWMGAKVTALVRDHGRVTGCASAIMGPAGARGQPRGRRRRPQLDGGQARGGDICYNPIPNARFFYCIVI